MNQKDLSYSFVAKGTVSTPVMNTPSPSYLIFDLRSKLKAWITEVKGIMMDNIEKVLDRGEKIELLVGKTDNLQFQAAAKKNVAAKSLDEAYDLRSLTFIIIVWLK
ncbi:Synaptobrevin [Cynara cardunculus var. scolymus]|uniref:Synaptobrevin n=1 Tax=Cynara cardunculus var. scolymus TaxID=59895 RepID=A0A124SGT4_CYNCS|nr:Synaptobrevin [Cynara cardunculus var. scolymus]